MSTATLNLNVNPQQGLQGLKQFDNGLNRTAEHVSNFRESLAEMSSFGGLSMLGLGMSAGYASKSFGKHILKMSADAQEAEGKFSAVMGSLSTEARRAGNELASSYNFASTTANNAVASMVDVLRKSGNSMRSSFDMTSSLMKRAADLQAFANEDDIERITGAFQAAMNGENERLKAFGVVINEATKKYQMEKEALAGIAPSTERAAKMHATYSLILQQTASAEGQVARESTNLGNRERFLSARVQDLNTALGNAFIPVATSAVNVLGKAANKLNALSQPTKDAAAWTAALSVAIAGVGIPLAKAFMGFKNFQNISSLAAAAQTANAAATTTSNAATESATSATIAESTALKSNSTILGQNETFVATITAQKERETAARYANIKALEAEIAALRAQNGTSTIDVINRPNRAKNNASNVGTAVDAINVLSLSKIASTKSASKLGFVGTAEKGLSKVNLIFKSTFSKLIYPLTSFGTVVGKIGTPVLRLLPHLLKFGGWFGLIAGSVYGLLKLGKNLPKIVDVIAPKIIGTFKNLPQLISDAWKKAGNVFSSIGKWCGNLISDGVKGTKDGIIRGIQWAFNSKDMFRNTELEKAREETEKRKKEARDARSAVIAQREASDAAIGAARLNVESAAANAASSFAGTNVFNDSESKITRAKAGLFGNGENEGALNELKKATERANQAAETESLIKESLVAAQNKRNGAIIGNNGAKQLSDAEFIFTQTEEGVLAFNKSINSLQQTIDENNKTIEKETSARETAQKALNEERISFEQNKDNYTQEQREQIVSRFQSRQSALDEQKRNTDETVTKNNALLEIQKQTKQAFNKRDFQKIYDSLTFGVTQEGKVLDKNASQAEQDSIVFGGQAASKKAKEAIADLNLSIEGMASDYSEGYESILQYQSQKKQKEFERRMKEDSERQELLSRTFAQSETAVSINEGQGRSYESRKKAAQKRIDLAQAKIDEYKTANDDVDRLTKEREKIARRRSDVMFSYTNKDGNGASTTTTELQGTLGNEDWKKGTAVFKRNVLQNSLNAMKELGIEEYIDEGGKSQSLSKLNLDGLANEELNSLGRQLQTTLNQSIGEAEQLYAQYDEELNQAKNRAQILQDAQNSLEQNKIALDDLNIQYDKEREAREREVAEINRSRSIRARDRATNLGENEYGRAIDANNRYYSRMASQTGRDFSLTKLGAKSDILAQQNDYVQNRLKEDIAGLRGEKESKDARIAELAIKEQAKTLTDIEVEELERLREKSNSIYDEIIAKTEEAEDKALQYNDSILALEDEKYNERMRLAEEAVKPYLDAYQSQAEQSKEDSTKGVSYVSKVEKGSSDAFAIMNRIYDAGQKTNAQRVDNIEKYVKRMTAYLTTMAANSASDFELEMYA